jgi:hypothetical protein
MANLMKRPFHVKKKRIGEFSGGRLAFDMGNLARYTLAFRLAFEMKEMKQYLCLRAHLIETETAGRDERRTSDVE